MTTTLIQCLDMLYKLLTICCRDRKSGMLCEQDALCYCIVTYFTEQHRQPFRNSSHSSYNLPSCPTATLFSKALPKKEDTWHHRYQHKLGVSVLSISHLVYLNIKQIQQRSHNQCKLVQWNWELPSLLNYFLLNYGISWNVVWQAMVTESSSWWWKTFKHWELCFLKSKICWNFCIPKCEWCGITACFLNKKCWAWTLCIFTTKHKTNDLMQRVVSATAYDWKLR